MTTFNLVWTPKNYGDYVTSFAVENGGNHIQSFERECDALSAANLSNKTCGNVFATSPIGHYCVQIEDEA
jgi:hypothetical protein